MGVIRTLVKDSFYLINRRTLNPMDDQPQFLEYLDTPDILSLAIPECLNRTIGGSDKEHIDRIFANEPVAGLDEIDGYLASIGLLPGSIAYHDSGRSTIVGRIIGAPYVLKLSTAPVNIENPFASRAVYQHVFQDHGRTLKIAIVPMFSPVTPGKLKDQQGNRTKDAEEYLACLNFAGHDVSDDHRRNFMQFHSSSLRLGKVARLIKGDTKTGGYIIFIDKSALNEFVGNSIKPKRYDELLGIYNKMHDELGAGKGLDYFSEFILPNNLAALAKQKG